MRNRNKSGIYKIYSVKDRSKYYVGSAVNLHRRKTEHFKRLKNNEHPNNILQNFYNKYGKSYLSFEIVEIVENADELIRVEQDYLDRENPYFNICKVAGSSKGRAWTEEAKEKRKRNIEAKKAKYGEDYYAISDSTRALMSEAITRRNQREREQKILDLPKTISNVEIIYAWNEPVLERGLTKYPIRLIGKCLYCGSVKNYWFNALKTRKIKNCGCIKVERTKKIPEQKEKVDLTRIHSKKRKNNTSGWAGVVYDKDSKYWRARLKLDGKLLDAGRYTCPTLAVIGRDRYILSNNLPHTTQVLKTMGPP